MIKASPIAVEEWKCTIMPLYKCHGTSPFMLLKFLCRKFKLLGNSEAEKLNNLAHVQSFKTHFEEFLNNIDFFVKTFASVSKLHDL